MHHTMHVLDAPVLDDEHIQANFMLILGPHWRATVEGCRQFKVLRFRYLDVVLIAYALHGMQSFNDSCIGFPYILVHAKSFKE